MTTPSVDTRIWRALNKRLQSCPTRPAVVIDPGEVEGLPTVANWLVSLIGADPVRVFVADDAPAERRGTLQVVHRVRPGDYATAGLIELGGQIAQHFKAGTRTKDGPVCVKVVSPPSVGDFFLDKGWVNIPVRIRWETAA